MSGHLLLRGAMVLLAATAGVVDAAAQPTQPIYLQYDGFVRAKDGSGGYILAFGYYNLNNVDIPIPPGSTNTFAPAAADRNQPVLFLKGRHRFACVMVVDKSFDGHLQWTVTFAGKTNTTTAKTLNPLYELELNSEKKVLHGFDPAASPKNVCINRAPEAVIAASPFEAPSSEHVELQAKAGQELPIAGRAEDDGLPRGSSVAASWKKISGPGEVTFSNADAAATRARFASAGTYELELSASDGEKQSVLKVTVRVQ
jgi:hypothetical protein